MDRLHRILFRLIPSCREAMELQSRALDGELGPRKRMLLRVHLMMCKVCRRYGKQIGFVSRCAKEIPERGTFEKTPPLPEECRARIRAKLAEGEK